MNTSVNTKPGNDLIIDSSEVGNMPSIPALDIPKPPVKRSIRSFIIPAAIFGGVFALILILLNLPATTKAVSYSVAHSEDKDNQQLTDEYRALYGYANHPELSYTQLAPQTAYADTGASVGATVDAKAQISIQKLNLTAPVLSPTGSSDAAILEALKNGVVMYPGSALPGQTGTTVIVGHSSSLPPWTKYSAIFANLGQLEPNDLIHLTFDGKEYIYRVTTVRRGSVQDILDSGMTGDLILSTCWPVGTDTNRVAVAAVRIQ